MQNNSEKSENFREILKYYIKPRKNLKPEKYAEEVLNALKTAYLKCLLISTLDQSEWDFNQRCIRLKLAQLNWNKPQWYTD